MVCGFGKVARRAVVVRAREGRRAVGRACSQVLRAVVWGGCLGGAGGADLLVVVRGGRCGR